MSNMNTIRRTNLIIRMLEPLCITEQMITRSNSTVSQNYKMTRAKHARD